MTDPNLPGTDVPATDTNPGTDPAATTATTDAPSKGSDTLLSGDAADDLKKAVPADWPADWRDRLAGADEKLKARVARFGTPNDVFKAWVEAEKKIASGQMKSQALPENPTPEQLAQYRAENGIPENYTDYDTALPDGMVMGDGDKEVVNNFLEAMHATNAPPAAVKTALSWYFAEQEKQAAAASESVAVQRKAAEDALRSAWGPEFRGNINAIKGFIKNRFGERAEIFEQLRLPDGSPLFVNPEFVNDFLSLVREVNPAEMVVPGSANPAVSIDSEIAKLKTLMQSDWKQYHADPKNSQRLGELLSAKERLERKSA